MLSESGRSCEFHSVLSFVQCRVTSVKEGNVVVAFDVAEEHTNPFGTLHGGFTATLVDIVTTSACMATQQGLPGVSVDLHISCVLFFISSILRYLGPAKIGDTVLLDAKVVKLGKRLAFTIAELRRKTDDALIATGVHTKAFPAAK